MHPILVRVSFKLTLYSRRPKINVGLTMSDAFISYSRRDAEFVQRLSNAFIKANRIIWVDWQNIPRGEDWWEEIQHGIEAADAVICVVTEHWLASPICHDEMTYARENNKRIIPIIRQKIEGDVEQRVKGQWMDQSFEEDARTNWDAIRHINWMFFDEDEKFNAEFAALLEALEEDQPHIKAHTRYQNRAIEWERSNSNPSYLLNGDDLTFAEKWMTDADRDAKDPKPTDKHRAYIKASRELTDARLAEQALREKRIRQFQRAAAVLMVVGVIAIAVAIAAGVTATSAIDDADAAEQREQDAVAQIAIADDQLGTATIAQGLAQDQASTATRQVATAIFVQEDAQDQASTAVALQEDAQNQAATATVQVGTAVVAQEDAQNQASTATVQVGTAVFAQENAQNQASTATVQVATAIALQEDAQDQASTATVQVGTAVFAQSEAQGLAATAQRDVAFAQATATQIPPTLTQAAVILEEVDTQREISTRLGVALSEIANNAESRALAIVEEIVELYPDEAYAYFARGLIYERTEDFNSALADYTRSLELDPEYYDALLNRAILYDIIGNQEAALADFQVALDLAPGDAQLYSELSFVFIASEDYDTAFEMLGFAIEFAPEEPLFYANRARLHADLGNIEAALEDANIAVNLNPEDADWYEERAYVYLQAGEFENGLTDINQAIEIDNETAARYLLRSALHTALGNSEAALDDINVSIALAPEVADAYVLRSFAFLQLGQLDKARADFNEAEALEYPFSDEELAIFAEAGFESESLEQISTRGVFTDVVEVGFAVTYSINGVAGQRITVDVQADDPNQLDTVVAIFSADEDFLDGNDDFGDTTNSRIEDFEFPADGEYIIVVGSFNEASGGAFTLTITEPGAEMPATTPDDAESEDDARSEPPEETSDDAEVLGDLSEGGDIRGTLPVGVVQYYEITVSAGDRVTISLDADSPSQYDTYLAFYGESDVPLVENDDVDGGNTNSRIANFTITQDGTYFIEVSSYENASGGAYTLSVDIQ